MQDLNKKKNYKKFKFCFFSRNGGVSKKNFYSLNCAYNKNDSKQNVNKNRILVKKKFCPKKRIILMNQVHSNKVIIVEKKKIGFHDADGIISKRDDITLGVLTADCAPVIILAKEFYGIIHAGWKGTLNGILEEALNSFIKKGESQKDISVFIGPHLKKNSFEVKSDFINTLKKSHIDVDKYIYEKNSNFFFDFSKLLSDKLNSFNLQKVSLSNTDTFKNPQNYFSHRYYTQKGIKNCGRQISLVSIKDNYETSIRK